MPNAEEPQSATLRRIQRRRRLANIRKTTIASGLLATALVSYCYVSRLPDSDRESSGTPDGGADTDATLVVSGTEEVTPRPGPEALAVPVDESDPLVRQLARAVSSRPEVAEWLVTEDLVRRFTAAVANVADGLTPRKQVEMMAPKQDFRVIERDERIFVDPENARRYDALVETFVSADPTRLVAVYRRLLPLLEQAYRDLGYPDGSFEEALAVAIEEVWATPVRDGELELIPGGVTFPYADPELESLSSAQKQFLRLGARNQRLVRAQIAGIARALALPVDLPDEIPTAPTAVAAPTPVAAPVQ